MARPRHQNGWITEHGKQIYGNFWRYVTDPVTGERKRRQASVPLGRVGNLRKWEAKERLKSLIAEELGPQQSSERPDPKTTFSWFVKYRYLPMREGRWRKATKDKTTYEINRYLVEYFGDRSLEEVTPFELQVHLNKLAKEFSDSIVRHAFSNFEGDFPYSPQDEIYHRRSRGGSPHARHPDGEKTEDRTEDDSRFDRQHAAPPR